MLSTNVEMRVGSSSDGLRTESRMRRITAIVILALSLALASAASDVETSFEGSVVDRVGKVIAGAQIIIIPIDQSAPIRLTLTDREGLTPGELVVVTRLVNPLPNSLLEFVSEEAATTDEAKYGIASEAAS